MTDYIFFSKFRTAVKELEVMVQNLINSAFETVRSVHEGVMLLDVFAHFSAREAIKRTIDKKTVEVFYIFSDQLNAVKRELSSKVGFLTDIVSSTLIGSHVLRHLVRV